jgi:NADH:ubiquinone oxidoreductase subunit 5 (subunit L)/multisubunit Na+/H+ antiporter MnhA subunit
MLSLKLYYFLGAGSVIHAIHNQQDIRYMGGLKKYLPVNTYNLFSGLHCHFRYPAFQRILFKR